MVGLHVVKECGGGSHPYRLTNIAEADSNGVRVSYVLARFPSLKSALSFKMKLEDAGRKQSEEFAIRAIAACDLSRKWAERIADATEEQGSAGYATKAHMRSWAQNIVELLTPLLEEMIEEEAVF